MFFFFFFIFFPSGLINGVLGLIFLSFYLFSFGQIDDLSRFSSLGLICFSDSFTLLSGFLPTFLFFFFPKVRHQFFAV